MHVDGMEFSSGIGYGVFGKVQRLADYNNYNPLIYSL